RGLAGRRHGSRRCRRGRDFVPIARRTGGLAQRLVLRFGARFHLGLVLLVVGLAFGQRLEALQLLSVRRALVIGHHGAGTQPIISRRCLLGISALRFLLPGHLGLLPFLRLLVGLGVDGHVLGADVPGSRRAL